MFDIPDVGQVIPRRATDQIRTVGAEGNFDIEAATAASRKHVGGLLVTSNQIELVYLAVHGANKDGLGGLFAGVAQNHGGVTFVPRSSKLSLGDGQTLVKRVIPPQIPDLNNAVLISTRYESVVLQVFDPRDARRGIGKVVSSRLGPGTGRDVGVPDRTLGLFVATTPKIPDVDAVVSTR